LIHAFGLDGTPVNNYLNF